MHWFDAQCSTAGYLPETCFLFLRVVFDGQSDVSTHMFCYFESKVLSDWHQSGLSQLKQQSE